MAAGSRARIGWPGRKAIFDGNSSLLHRLLSTTDTITTTTTNANTKLLISAAGLHFLEGLHT